MPNASSLVDTGIVKKNVALWCVKLCSLFIRTIITGNESWIQAYYNTITEQSSEYHGKVNQGRKAIGKVDLRSR